MPSSPATHPVFLSLGSNLGDSLFILDTCVQMIAATEGIHNVRASRYYRTSPVGVWEEMNDFINAAVAFETSLSPEALKTAMQRIERTLGKVPKAKHDPRLLDIDILFYGTQTIDLPDLTIPHPRWMERLFVLVPLAELTQSISLPNGDELDLCDYIERHTNPHNEVLAVMVS